MDAFLVIFFIAFIGIFIFIFATIFKSVSASINEKRYNDSQPVITKDVKITGKRTELSGGGKHSVSTSYFTTFEFAEDKKRLELEVTDGDYGLMAEGDLGKLTFQGRRYQQFQRNL